MGRTQKVTFFIAGLLLLNLVLLTVSQEQDHVSI